jgi:hypothetical protein
MRWPGGRKGSAALAAEGGWRQRRRGGEDAVEVEMALGHVGEAGEPGRHVGKFGRLHQPEMAFR